MADNKEIIYRSAWEHSESLAKGEYSSVDLAKASLERSDETRDLGIYLELDRDRILKAAAESDRRRSRNESMGPLDGIPVALKDNITVKGQITSCASKILENFRSPYSATVVEKLEASGAILFGRTNMDEFAMGSSTENSAFQKTRNPWDPERVPGGSSGGSAAAVGASTVPLSLGSDTGGSIRQPAALCGVVGIKPTYGRVSRYGLVAFASSLDQIGPFARSVDDGALLLSAINGHDRRDSTSHKKADEIAVPGRVRPLDSGELKKLRVGVFLPDTSAGGFDADVIASMNRAVEWLEGQGAKIVPIKSHLWDSVIPIYYILATAEASSNLSRYDGIRYGRRAGDAKNLLDLYTRSRTEGFGPEVKRRILLGTFVLSSGYYDAYYNSAQKARRLIQQEYMEFFKGVDVILQPTSPTTAFKLGEKTANPIAMYQSDLLTISVNLGGVPSLSIPAGLDHQGLPVGLQLTGNYFEEGKLFRIASTLMEGIPGFTFDYSTMQEKKTADNGRHQSENSLSVKKTNKELYLGTRQTKEAQKKAGEVKPAAKTGSSASAKESQMAEMSSAPRSAKKSVKKSIASKKKSSAPAKKKAVKKSVKKSAKKSAAKKSVKKSAKKTGSKKTAKKTRG